MSPLRDLARTLRHPLALAVLAFVAGYALYQRWQWSDPLQPVPAGAWDLVPEILFSPHLLAYVLLPSWMISALVSGRAWSAAERLVRAGSLPAASWKAERRGLARFGRVAFAGTVVVLLCSFGMPLSASAPPRTVAADLRQLDLTPVVGCLAQLALCALFFGAVLWMVTSLTLSAGVLPAALVAAAFGIWVVFSGAGLLPAGPANAKAFLDLRAVLAEPLHSVTGWAALGIALLGATVWPARARVRGGVT